MRRKIGPSLTCSDNYTLTLYFAFIELYERDAELWTHSIAARVAASLGSFVIWKLCRIDTLQPYF